MHELSIAAGIVELAEEYAQREKAKCISKIEIEIGTLSGVVRESLELAMEFAVKNTLLEKAQLVIIEIEANGKCIQCGHIFSMTELYDCCPECKTFNPEVIQGKEMRLSSISIEE